MRGKLPSDRIAAIEKRITPADAGKTAASAERQALMMGSPPRMRGKQIRDLPTAQIRRITPADAGKTSV